MKQLIVLNDNICLGYIRRYITIFNTVSNVQVFLLLFSNAERFNFFLQWHKMLEKNLPSEDKQLFRDYLDSCREKLQNKKDYYNWFIENNFSWFTRIEKQLTAIVIFGIITSAVVLTIYFLEMYAATWFFGLE